jgi:hypothetical protein
VADFAKYVLVYGAVKVISLSIKGQGAMDRLISTYLGARSISLNLSPKFSQASDKCSPINGRCIGGYHIKTVS